MISVTSQEKFQTALSREPENNQPKKTMPAKPQFKKSVDIRNEASALCNHKEPQMRESFNQSQISHIDPSKDEEY